MVAENAARFMIVQNLFRQEVDATNTAEGDVAMLKNAIGQQSDRAIAADISRRNNLYAWKIPDWVPHEPNARVKHKSHGLVFLYCLQFKERGRHIRVLLGLPDGAIISTLHLRAYDLIWSKGYHVQRYLIRSHTLPHYSILPQRSKMMVSRILLPPIQDPSFHLAAAAPSTPRQHSISRFQVQRMDPSEKVRVRTFCSIDDCDRMARISGFCYLHSEGEKQ